jgi:hypothetical protein
MLSRWTKKDAQNNSNGGGSGGGANDRPDAGSSATGGGQLSPTAAANGSGLGGYPWPYDKERHGIDGLTPSERAMLEGMERFYGMENVRPPLSLACPSPFRSPGLARLGRVRGASFVGPKRAYGMARQRSAAWPGLAVARA